MTELINHPMFQLIFNPMAGGANMNLVSICFYIVLIIGLLALIKDLKSSYRPRRAKPPIKENALEMDSWHTCETTHCIAGWACHLAKDGKELEDNYLKQAYLQCPDLRNHNEGTILKRLEDEVLND